MCVSGRIVFCSFVYFGCPGDHFGGHFGVLEHPEAPKGHAMDPKMPPGQDLENFGGIPEKNIVPFWSTFSICGVFLNVVCYFFAVFVDFRCPGDYFGGHFGVLERPEAPKGTTETQRERKRAILHENG